MSEYGLTLKGPNIKRLDVILDEMHTELSEQWNVNTRQKSESFVNNLLTNVADKIAELWEFGEVVYFSQYPSSAEGISLDNAGQFGGVSREGAKKSYYPIHCKGRDGTTLAVGTMISSNTNPATNLSLTEEKQITRTAFNEVEIKIVAYNAGDVYTLAVNNAVYSYVSKEGMQSEILNGLAESITDKNFTVTVDEVNKLMILKSNDITLNSTLVLSENLTTETVTSIITFGTVDKGDIVIPEGAITNIVKADAGLLSVTNLCGYTAGRDEESDAEYRQSYADKIFNRSSMMLESIRSSILQNVQGVTSVAPYENESNVTDEYGRPPHSIEIVVDGGEASQIAKQIFTNKAPGISTHGSVEVDVVGVNGENITVRFNRPTQVYVWMRLVLTLKKTEPLPVNYAEILKTTILEKLEQLNAGDDVTPQEFASDLYKACTGIGYIDITLAATEEQGVEPSEYTERSITMSARQKVYTDASMIEVVIDG